MKKTLVFLSAGILILSGCTSPQKRQTNEVQAAQTGKTAPVQKIDKQKLEQSMARLNAEISELDKMEQDVYAKSLKGDPILKERLAKRISEIGTVETLQANLKVLETLQTENTDKK